MNFPSDSGGRPGFTGDRKSTRLNSSHLVISYAVFCLKKKKKKYIRSIRHSQYPIYITYMLLSDRALLISLSCIYYRFGQTSIVVIEAVWHDSSVHGE